MASYENVKGIRIEIGGDASPLYTALNEASQKTKELESQLVDLNKNLKLDPKNVELVQKKFDTLSQLVATSEEKVKLLKKGLQDAQLKFKNGEITEEQLKKITSDLERATKETKYWKNELTKFEGAEGQLVNVASKMKDVKQTQEDLRKEFHELYDELNRTDFKEQPQRWQELNQKLEENRQKQEEARIETEKLGGEFQNLVQQVAQGASGMQTFSESTDGATQGMSDMGSEEQTFESTLDGLKDKLSMSSMGFALMNEAVKIVSKALQEAMKELQKWLDNLDDVDVKTKALAKDTEQYLKSLEKSTLDNKLNISVLDARFRSIDRLNREIQEGNRLGKDTSKLQKQLEREVKALNSAVGSEVLTIDKQTGTLKQNATQLNRTREAVLAYAEAQYELDKIMELVARRHELEEQIAGRTYQNYAGGLGKLQEELAQVNEQLDYHTGAYTDANEKLYEFNDITQELTGSQAELSKELENNSTIAIQSAIESYNKEQEYQKKRFDVIVETDEKIKEHSEISLKERIEIMRHNADAMLRYEGNIEYLRKLMLETTDSELKEELGNYLNYLSNNFSEENLQILNDIVEDMGEKGGEGAREYLSFFKSENLPDEMKSVGQEMMNGLNNGIENGESKVLNTASSLAQKIADKLKIKVGISASEGAISFNPRRGAQGGIVTQPTTMLVGEMGSEVILPLDKLAGIITATMQQSGGAGGSYTMNVYPQSMSPSEQETLFENFDRRFGASTSRRNI